MHTRHLLPFFALPIIPACTKVAMTTVALLNASSPMEADPQGFEFAVTMPDAASVQKNGAEFRIAMTQTKLGESIDRDFILQQRSSPDGQMLFRVNPADLDELRALQAKARAWETTDPVASSGSISVFVAPCAIGEGPALSDTFSVSLRTEIDGVFLPLIRDASIEDVIASLNSDDPQADLRQLPQCD